MVIIFVVDDEMGIWELFFEIFGDEGYVVEVVENVQCVCEYCVNVMFDFVLFDIWMLDIDGVMLFKEWVL